MHTCQACGADAALDFCAACGVSQEHVDPKDPWQPVTGAGSLGAGHCRYRDPRWPSAVSGEVAPYGGDIDCVSRRGWDWWIIDSSAAGEESVVVEGNSHSLSAARTAVEQWTPR